MSDESNSLVSCDNLHVCVGVCSVVFVDHARCVRGELTVHIEPTCKKDCNKTSKTPHLCLVMSLDEKSREKVSQSSQNTPLKRLMVLATNNEHSSRCKHCATKSHGDNGNVDSIIALVANKYQWVFQFGHPVSSCIVLSLAHNVTQRVVEVFDALIRQHVNHVIETANVPAEIAASPWLERGARLAVGEVRHRLRRARRRALRRTKGETRKRHLDAISDGGNAIASGIKRGASLISGGVVLGSHMLKQHIEPRKKPLQLSNTTTNTISAVKSATSTASSCKCRYNLNLNLMKDSVKYFSHKLSFFCYIIGSIINDFLVASMLHSGAETVFNSVTDAAASSGISLPGKSSSSTTVAVAGTTINAACNIVMACQDATHEVAQSMGDATADLLEHKFGGSVGAAARDGAETFSHVRHLPLKTQRLFLKSVSSMTSSLPDDSLVNESSNEDDVSSLDDDDFNTNNTST